MKYFFILGNNPTLSVAEISAVFGLRETKFPVRLARLAELKRTEANGEARVGNLVSGNVFILETDQEIDAKVLIKRLGGTIKIGEIKNEVDKKDQEKLKKEVIKLLKPGGGKFKFGFSYYGSGKLNLKPLAMETKKYLREKNISCRWVVSKEKTLSSVVVEQNKLTGKGIEIVLIDLAPSLSFLSASLKAGARGGKEGGVLIGQTLAVQPFKELSFRDYGRPARDDRSGMLPPKLAQIMINLTPRPSPLEGEGARRAGEVLLDPFCGSGTILTEAMLMLNSPSPLEEPVPKLLREKDGGEVTLIGSDISQKAITDTKKNIEWIKKNYELGIRNYELHKKNVLELSKLIKINSIDAIVTEPYLGPPRGKLNLKKTISELEKLYSDSLLEFKKILKPSGIIVMIWPLFILHPTPCALNPNLNGFKIVNPIPERLRDNPNIKLTNRNTIVYGREGQKIWREIVVLR